MKNIDLVESSDIVLGDKNKKIKFKSSSFSTISKYYHEGKTAIKDYKGIPEVKDSSFGTFQKYNKEKVESSISLTDSNPGNMDFVGRRGLSLKNDMYDNLDKHVVAIAMKKVSEESADDSYITDDIKQLVSDPDDDIQDNNSDLSFDSEKIKKDLEQAFDSVDQDSERFINSDEVSQVLQESTAVVEVPADFSGKDNLEPKYEVSELPKPVFIVDSNTGVDSESTLDDNVVDDSGANNIENEDRVVPQIAPERASTKEKKDQELFTFDSGSTIQKSIIGEIENAKTIGEVKDILQSIKELEEQKREQQRKAEEAKIKAEQAKEEEQLALRRLENYRESLRREIEESANNYEDSMKTVENSTSVVRDIESFFGNSVGDENKTDDLKRR